MTSIWFPNNKYPPNTKNYLPCFVLGGGFSIRRKGLSIIIGPYQNMSKLYILLEYAQLLGNPRLGELGDSMHCPHFGPRFPKWGIPDTSKIDKID